MKKKTKKQKRKNRKEKKTEKKIQKRKKNRKEKKTKKKNRKEKNKKEKKNKASFFSSLALTCLSKKKVTYHSLFTSLVSCVRLAPAWHLQCHNPSVNRKCLNVVGWSFRFMESYTSPISLVAPFRFGGGGGGALVYENAVRFSIGQLLISSFLICLLISTFFCFSWFASISVLINF